MHYWLSISFCPKNDFVAGFSYFPISPFQVPIEITSCVSLCFFTLLYYKEFFFLSQDFYILISPMTELKLHSFAKNLSKIKLYPGVGPPVLKYFISFPHTFRWFRLICIQGADLLWVNSVSGYFAKYYSCYSDSSIIYFFSHATCTTISMGKWRYGLLKSKRTGCQHFTAEALWGQFLSHSWEFNWSQCHLLLS